jgi:c-di-GMP-binding flagellar brake protein YcgR
MNKNTERRRFKRIFFSIEDGIIGLITLPPSHNKVLLANIMDLGAEGMGITLDKSECPHLDKGQKLILKEVNNSDSLNLINNITLEIRWVLNHRSLKHIALGCQFVNPPQAVCNQVQHFMDSWEMKMA